MLHIERHGHDVGIRVYWLTGDEAYAHFAAILVRLLGWHWEFVPAFAAELVPGVDLVPFWTLAVVNVYRKWKQITITTEEAREQRPALRGQQNSS